MNTFTKFSAISISIVLQGCLSFELQSPIPKQSYYFIDRQDEKGEPAGCSSGFAWISLNVNVNTPYDSKNIVVREKNGNMLYLESQRWADLPKNMIKSSLTGLLLKRCVYPTAKLYADKSVNDAKISIYDMYVETDEKLGYKSRISIGYELIMKDKTYMGVITEGSNSKDAVEAMQNAFKKVADRFITFVERKQDK